MEIQYELINSIKESDVIELLADFSELSIDQLLDEGLLKDIPWVGWIFKAKNIYHTLSDQSFLAKIMSFLLSLETIDNDDKVRFVNRIESDHNFKNQLGIKLLLVLEKIDDIEKPAMLSKVFCAFIKGYIDCDDFYALADAINNAYISDLKKLLISNIERPEYVRLDLEGLYRSNLTEIQKNIKFQPSHGISELTIEFKISYLGNLLIDILQNKIKARVDAQRRRKVLPI
ncbi:MAG: hypothetical protein HGB15_11615 [Chlorobaculum sp.]|nr:hypothetical protein [Chlorobaculum sp.]